MCRVEERIYIGADGHRSKFEESFPCDKARGGRLCSKVKRRTTEYYPKKGTMSRDDTPSPNNPPTPTGTGTYITQQIRPAGPNVRPPTRDGTKIKPEIVIEFGGSKKGKSSKYPSVSVSAGTYKRSSLGASSVGSNDVAVESPGSDASHTIRTGFPEAPLPPPAVFGTTDSYIATPTMTQGHHRHTSSGSSFTGSSRTPSLYITSDPDYDSPTTYRATRNTAPPIVHNPTVGVSPSSPSRGQHGFSSSAYRTAVVTPQGFSQDTHTPDGLFPLDYSEFADRSASSHASSGAPEITRRAKDRDERRKKKEEEELRKRQEEQDRKLAEEMAKEENVKQVRFELGRAEARAQERAERAFAEKEKIRYEIREEAREEARRIAQKEREKLEREQREEARRQAQKERDRQEEQMAKERKKEKTKPPTNDFAARPTRARRGSMTQAQIEEQRRLLAAEGLHMQGEREQAEAREREERLAAARQQQEAPGYWDPRGGDRTLSNTTSTMPRRNSISRRNSVSNGTAPQLGRSNSNRRTNIIQPNPPGTNSQAPQPYTARPPSARRDGPPISFPANFNQDYNRPPSARRNSFSQENPFAAPPTRGSGSSLDNPFAPAPSVLSPTGPAPDPWDVRVVQDALPSTREPSDSRYTLQQRGEAVINRSAPHSRAQQATRAMGRATGFEDDYQDDSDIDRTPSYPPRSAMSGKGKKKY